MWAAVLPPGPSSLNSWRSEATLAAPTCSPESRIAWRSTGPLARATRSGAGGTPPLRGGVPAASRLRACGPRGVPYTHCEGVAPVSSTTGGWQLPPPQSASLAQGPQTPTSAIPSPATSTTAQIPDAQAEASPSAGQNVPSAPVPCATQWRKPAGCRPSMMTFGVQTSPAAQLAVEAQSLQNVSGKTPLVSTSGSQLRPGAHPIAAGLHITPSSPLVHARSARNGQPQRAQPAARAHVRHDSRGCALLSFRG